MRGGARLSNGWSRIARRIRVPERGVTKTAFTCKSGKLNVELSRDEGRLREIRGRCA